MYKFITLTTVMSLLSACSTFAPIDKIPVADNSDLESLTDCQMINHKIEVTQQTIKNYKKARSMNTTANVLSDIGLLLSLGSSGFDYSSNDDYGFDEVIQLWEEHIKQLNNIQT